VRKPGEINPNLHGLILTRVALRESPARGEELRELKERLRCLDARARGGAWTLCVLEILAAHTGVRAADLCGLAGQEKGQFKRNVRKLKNLGLTESLGVGYRQSPRGVALLEDLKSFRHKPAA
jgi:hypothetical protein